MSVGLGNKKAKFEDFLVNKQRKRGRSSLMEKVGDTNHEVMTTDAVRAIFGGVTVKGK